MKQISSRALFSASAREIDAAAWNACANPDGLGNPHPFTRHEFFVALEESGSASAGSGWQPCHLVIERNRAIEALMPLYLKSHSQGEYVFDHGWAEAFERAGGRYYPKLQASVPFTPVTGPRLLVTDGPATNDLRLSLLSAGENAARSIGASSLHITFMNEEDWKLAGTRGFLQRIDQQFHWMNRGYTSFEDFLNDLSSSKRKSLRKERTAIRAAGISFDWCTGSDLTEGRWDAFFDFYLETASHKWGHPYLTREFFSRIGATMPNAILLVLAREGPRLIAGALNFIGNGTLYGRNWGAAEFVPFLHFETCYYQAIEFAIANGLHTVEAGAQGTHKALRGYRPVVTRSAHFIVHAGLRGAVADYLRREREAVSMEMAGLEAHTPFRKDA